jgi:plasmid stability protein
MPALHVRELDDVVVEALKERARRNHRSLQGEVRSILEAAAGDIDSPETGGGRRLRLRTVSVGRAHRFSRDVLYDDGNR